MDNYITTQIHACMSFFNEAYMVMLFSDKIWPNETSNKDATEFVKAGIWTHALSEELEP